MTTYNVVSPTSLQSGQPEDVSVVLANLQAIASVLNGNLDNGNLHPAAGIAATKIAGYPFDGTKALLGDGTWGAISVPSGIPVGATIMWPGAAAPTDWLLCDGASLERTAYPVLFTAIGVAYGSVDATHFTLPDFRGRVPVGKGTNALVNALGNNDGVAVADRRPKHRHTPHAHTFNKGAGNSVGGGQQNWGSSADTAATAVGTTSVDGGSGVAADSLDAPAYQVINYIIRAL
jgi:microcystin-dependent protein